MILDKLVQSTQKRIEIQKQSISPAEMEKIADETERKDFEFEKALARDDMSFICEVKKASPSKGLIAENFPYVEIACDYEQAGATAISILTEPEYFKGDIRFLEEISRSVHVPLLRKDFVIDTYMIDQAHSSGASAVLLICSLLDTDTLRKYIARCDRFGLSALVEAHDETELRSAVSAGARVIGVNNRNLRDFTVDFENSLKLRRMAPADCIFVAESGIKTARDIELLRDAGVDAVLIGETLMRAEDKKAMLDELRGKA